MSAGNNPAIVFNANEVQIRGAFGLTAAAAVTTPIVGDACPLSGGVTKTGTGTYRVRIPAVRASRFSVRELVDGSANFIGATSPATAVNVRVTNVTNEAGTNDILIDILTANATWVATDTTASTRICYNVTFKYVARIGG